MMDVENSFIDFRRRLLAQEVLVGAFQKTPSSIVSEVLGLTALDLVCLDTEHAPFDRLELDACIFALRAAAKPCLVRVASASPAAILNALDCGASGIVAPHIHSARQAMELAAAARYGRGGRGYAGSSRAAGYTTKPMAAHKADSDRSTVVIAQIEDVEAVEAIDEIAAVDGIDCLFIGCIDLTVALGADSPSDAAVVEAMRKVCAACCAKGRAVGMYLPDVSEAPKWRNEGVSLFLSASEHTFILQGAARLMEKFTMA